MRNPLGVESDPARESVGIFGLELEVEFAVHFLETRASVDLPDVLALLDYRRLVTSVAAEDLRAHDKLEDIVEGDDSGSPAVFVEDDGETLVATRKDDEEVVERNVLWNENRLFPLSGADVENGLYRVGRAAEDGKVAVLSVCKRGGLGFFGKVEVETFDVDARRHLVVRVGLGEAQDALYHLYILGKRLVLLRRGLEDRHKLLV